MQATLIARAAIGVIAVAIPSTAFSSGSSGGSTPSMNAPEFDAAAEYRKGIDALQASKFAEAKSSFARVLGVAPGDANTNFLAGLADAGLSDYKAAARHYERAVRADGKLVPAQQELAITYVKLG